MKKTRYQKQKGRNQKGFTLVELMVVVIIIGILIAIAVPKYQSVTDKANRSAVEFNLRTIDGAIMAYQAANNGNVPENTTAGSGGTLMAPDKYLQTWPTGPDGVTYQVNDGQGQANKGSGDWFGTATSRKLPIANWD